MDKKFNKICFLFFLTIFKCSDSDKNYSCSINFYDKIHCIEYTGSGWNDSNIQEDCANTGGVYNNYACDNACVKKCLFNEYSEKEYEVIYSYESNCYYPSFNTKCD
ncbi:MAG: hypothetical protein OEZ22_12415 [Spirochaetia bacterium]|nr:hypothetical protein [Spirochaetia bacterium]